MRVLALVTLLPLCWTADAGLQLAPAAAASFDCAKAASPLETAICSDDDLSRYDEVLATAYATALGGLSDKARKTMQAGERAWLDFAPLSCTDDARPVTTSFTDDQVSCLADAFRSRITDLEQSRMRGLWRFYSRDAFKVLKDPNDPEFGPKVASKTYQSPRIDGDDPVATAFNTAMAEQDVASGAVTASGAIAGDDATTDENTTIKVIAINDQLISLEVDSDWYGHGAAHPNYAINYLHFLIEQKRLLKASDVFDKPGWEDALGKLVLDQLDQTVEGGIWEEARADVPKAAADPADWKFSEDGLVVQFQPYEVTAYAAGAPTVTIPWDDLQPYLAEGLSDTLTYWSAEE